MLLNLLRWTGLAIGVVVFFSVVFSHYERAVTVSGRTEVITIVADGTDFSSWTLPGAALAPDPGGTIQAASDMTLDLAAGTQARLVRHGRDAVLVSFTAPSAPSSMPGAATKAAKCPDGTHQVGSIGGDDTGASPLCDSARVSVTVKPGDLPLVVSLRGKVDIGEEVRAGAGAQPMLLDGSAQLLVRHGAPFTTLCRLELLHAICDRFVATKFDFSAGDALSFNHAGHPAEATGFVRIDPEDTVGGLRFDLAAADAALEVRRMKGDPFELSESLFERIEKSPLLQTLNATLVAIGLVWWFVRIPGETRGGPAAAVVLALSASLLLPAPARAQQALLRAGETGQVLLRSRADRCYAVTPLHVMGGETSGTLVLEKRSLADADLLRRVPAAPETLAVLLTRAVPPDLCPAFVAAPALDGLLRARSNAVLRLVRPDGSFDRVPLVVLSVDVETFEVRPQDAAEALAQGMSGGTVLIDDQPVGLLTDVRDEGHVGRVSRLDRVFERLEPYLGAGLLTVATAPASVGPTNSASMSAVKWTAEPVTPANRAETLATNGGQPWRVTDTSASIVFKIDQERAVLVGVQVDASGLPDPPRTVEVLFGSGENGPWRSVATFALEAGDTVRNVAVPLTRAGFLMLRAREHQAGVATMGLRRVSLLVKGS